MTTAFGQETLRSLWSGKEPKTTTDEISLATAIASANHTMGIALWGTEAEISSVVVRDTLPDQSDGTAGYGLSAACDPDTGGCGSLRLDQALVLANHDIGLGIAGTEAELSSVVVRDTLPDPGDGTGGNGLMVTCDPESGVGSLRLDQALVQGNHSMGIAIWGTETEISSVVVLGSLPDQGDGTGGYGIYSECGFFTGVCGDLRINHALLKSNHAAGIVLFGAEAEISSVVVLGSLPDQSDGTGGYGIHASCDTSTGVCGDLRLDHALLRANHAAGIALWNTETEISSVVIRDTLPRQSDGKLGSGLSAACDPDTGDCSSLRLDHTLLLANHEMAIALWDTETELSSVVVRDTLPDQSNGTRGYGIHASCHTEWGVCPSLLVADSVIQRGEMIGILIVDVPTRMTGSVVVDIRQNEAGPWAGEYGNGVLSMCDDHALDCATLEIAGCLVDSSFAAGVVVQRISGSFQGSVVRDVFPRALDSAYGYGIQVEGVPGAPPTVFHVSNSLIQDAGLAGILFYLAGGTVSGSQIAGGQYSIVMNQGANPIVEDDNDLSGTLESEPTWANMDPAPVPPPVPPIDIEP
ncbi:hypothetical protein ACFL51_02245 [Myxococcota bacterium]